jgi:hypothetical protein
VRKEDSYIRSYVMRIQLDDMRVTSESGSAHRSKKVLHSISEGDCWRRDAYVGDGLSGMVLENLAQATLLTALVVQLINSSSGIFVVSHRWSVVPSFSKLIRLIRRIRGASSIKIVATRREPTDDRETVAIYISHHADLAGTFLRVVLVDTQLIDPQVMVSLTEHARTENFQKHVEILPNAEDLPFRRTVCTGTGSPICTIVLYMMEI